MIRGPEGQLRRQLVRVEADLTQFLALGREDPDRRAVRVGDLVAEAVVLLGPQCRHAGVDLRGPTGGADAVVPGDPGRLGHVVVNLLTNAVDAAGPGARVRVDVRRAAASILRGNS